MSSATSTCFCAARRASMAGLSRARISFKGRSHRPGIKFAAGIHEQARRGQAEFAKGNFHRAESRVAQELFPPADNHHRAGRRRLHDFGAQFHRQRGEDGLQRQFQFVRILGRHGRRPVATARGWRRPATAVHTAREPARRRKAASNAPLRHSLPSKRRSRPRSSPANLDFTMFDIALFRWFNPPTSRRARSF